MKKLILLFCFLALASPKIYPQLDNFSYPVGDTLANYWNSLSPLGVPYIRIAAPGLVFPSYAGSGIGNAAKLDTIGPDGVAKHFSFGGISTGSVYGSFMVRVFSAETGGNYFAAIAPVFSIGNSHSRVFIRDSSGRVAFGISKRLETPIYTFAQYLRNTTYLLVLKYTFNSGTSNDSVSLFVFSSPAPSIEPVPTLGPKGGPEPDMSNAGAFNLLQGYFGNYGVIVDGIYVDVFWNNTVLPIELSSFNATVNKRDVVLNWTTVSEVNNSGFEVERLSIVNGAWSTVGNVNGNGTMTTSYNYSFTDRNLNIGIYNYRLKQIDFNGNFEYFNLSNEVNIGVPTKFDLLQNYPNPFNPTTKINFELTKDGNVILSVYDISGKLISIITRGLKEAGYHTVEFDASFVAGGLPSGVYFYKLEYNSEEQNFAKVMKMAVLK